VVGRLGASNVCLQNSNPKECRADVTVLIERELRGGYFDVLLTVHLNTILEINQLNA